MPSYHSISRRRGRGNVKQPQSFKTARNLIFPAVLFLQCWWLWRTLLSSNDNNQSFVVAPPPPPSPPLEMTEMAFVNDDIPVNNEMNDMSHHDTPPKTLAPSSPLLLLEGHQLSNEIRSNTTSHPTMNRPFIFFHVPKCGGSTLRKVFNEAAKAIGKRMFAPCYDSVPCPITENDIIGKSVEIEEKSACAEVLAGHFTTKLVTVMANQTLNHRAVVSSSNQCTRNWTSTTTTTTMDDSPPLLRPTFDCLVAVREPISRFVSHYYHFIEKDNPLYSGRILKDMSLEDLTTIIHNSANNTMLDYFSSHLPGLHPERQENSFTLQEKIEAASNFLKQCVVLVMEDWQTSTRLVESAVPWLRGHLSHATALNKRSSRVKNHESIEDFTPDVATALREMLKGDDAVYNIAVNVYQQQLKLFGIEASTTRKESKTKNTKDESTGIMESQQQQQQQRWSDSNFYNKIPFIKAVTYFGRGNPLNFWYERFEDYIDADFSRLREEGFNSLILLVPWANVQLTVHPPTYKLFVLSRIEYVMQKAVEYNLFTIFRVSYPHGFDPMNEPASGHERCRLIMDIDTSNGIQDGWLDYMSVLNGIFTKEQYNSSYLYSFTSWEDFFCLISIGKDTPDDQRIHLSKQLGFDKFLMDNYKPEELEKMFKGFTPGEYPIPKWSLRDEGFPAYIKFIDMKWWKLVMLGRSVHPNLTMELRIDKEGGKIAYDMHLEDKGPPKQAYWAGYMGSRPGIPLVSDVAVSNLERAMKHASVDAQSPIILGQFNFQDNTPHMVMRNIILEECNTFLEKSAAVLKKYTKGYGLWAYRNYRQSEIFNGSFLLGLEGWNVQKVGDGHVELDSDRILLIAGQSEDFLVKLVQGAKQQSELNCDDHNKNMELCFRYRMKNRWDRLHVIWDGKKIGERIEFSSDWKEKCMRVPSLETNQFYTIGFQVEGLSSVNIQNVEFFCHTHMMYMNDVHNNPNSTCGKGIKTLNQLLD